MDTGMDADPVTLYERKGAKERGEYRGIAGLVAKDLNLVVDPQSDQVKNNQTGKDVCPNEKQPRQPLSKGSLSLRATVHFERLFVDCRAVPILDPRRVSFTPLVLEISKRPIRVVGCKFDYPSRHGILPRSILLSRSRGSLSRAQYG
jgi:hypothetical protein